MLEKIKTVPKYVRKILHAGGIKCYNCMYSDECTKDKLVADKANYLVTCPLSQDRCMTLWRKEYDLVVKMCSTKSLCDYDKKTCDDMKDGECAFNCCDTDECNAGSPELPSERKTSNFP
ncbi:hypothetical protein ACROYT_G044577 [Oculina patagonica]